MKLFKYNQFLGTQPLNENLDKAKKFLKDQYLIKKVAGDLGFISTDLDYDLRHGKKSLTSKDFTPDQFNQIKMKMRDVRISDEQVRNLEKNEDFIKLRELFKDNIGYLYNFVYMYFVENVEYEAIERLYQRLIHYKDLLGKMSKKFDVNFIDETLPRPDNNHTNAEILSDELEKLESYRLVKRIIDSLPPKLKRAANNATPLQMDQLAEIALGFEKVPEEKKEMVWKTFFGEMLEDRYETTLDGKPNPNFGKMVWRSRLRRFEQLDNPLVEFIKSAKQHLDASSTEGYSSRMEKINKCNDLLGVKGCKIVYNEAGIMLVEVNSYAANKLLNAHCSHCIVNSESFWNTYLGEYNIQYYIYNFNLSNTDVYSSIGVTIRPNRTYQGGACQTLNNRDIGHEFKNILNKWEKEYQLDVDLWSLFQPLSDEEIERRKKAKDAERFIIRKTIPDPETGKERTITAEDIKRFVRENGADVNRDNGKALVNAVEDDDIERVKTILNLGGSPNLLKGSDSAIAKAKTIEMVKLLVSHHAVLTGQVFENILLDDDALEFCLRAGADPNFNSNLPIRKVCKGTYKNISDIGESHFGGYKLLLKYGVNEEENGVNFVIKWAAEYGRMDIINDQMAKGCKSGFTEAFSWMGHTKKISGDLKKSTGQFLMDNALKYEKETWNALIEKLARRGKKIWIEEM